MSVDPITAGAVANVVSAAIVNFVKYLRECIDLCGTRRLDLTVAAEELGRAVETLLAVRNDNERIVQQNTTKTTSNCYNLWVRSVTKILGDVNDLRTKCGKKRNFLQRVFQSKLDGEVRNIRQQVVELLETGKFPGGILVEKPPEHVVKQESVPEIKEFDALQRCLEELLELLRSQQMYKIAIWGPRGVGKTTIMQNLNNHEKVAEMFEIVIWIKVEGSKEKLQEKIAKRLNLNLQGNVDVEENAKSISEELKKKKFLLLLDDFVDFIDLKDIGIPDDKNDSKVVLTTVDVVFCSKMELVRDIQVKKLAADDAWKMFKGIVKDKIDIPGVEPFAQEVARECDGYPLLIKIVANSFKLKDSIAEWRNGLKELRNWPDIEASEISEFVEVHAFFKFCYDNLKDENKQICFLYGALHPANTKISSDYMVKCWAAERFLGDIDDKRSLRDACDRGRAILKHLTKVSLLEAGERLEHFKVDSMVRRVALHISSKNPNCKFLIGEQTETSLASQDMSEQATRIFMIDTGLKELPNFPECSKVLSLLLQKNPEFEAFPPSFFTTKQELQVLNLYRTGIKSLPSSFFIWLTGLKALFLNACPNLEDLPHQIEQLHHLEVLDIRDCKVIFIPTFIGKLVSLRCLRVPYYKERRTNGRGEIMTEEQVISKLSKLEELVIDVVSFNQWHAEAINVIQQVTSLKKLTSLKTCFPNTKVLTTLMNGKSEWRGRQQLSVFWSFVGQNTDPPEILDYFSYPVDRFLRYDGYDDDSSTSTVFPETDALELIGHDKIKYLSDFIKAPGLHGVRVCLVKECSNMETVLAGNKAGLIDILPSLEQLHLRNLLKLKSIFEDLLSEARLSKLHTIVVCNCMSLIKIGKIQQLPNLKKLTIESCHLVEKLIVNTKGNGSMQNLEILELFYLTDLSTICTDKSLLWPHLKVFRAFECPKLKRLPFNGENAKELKKIEGQQAWWGSLEWVDDDCRGHFGFSPFALSR
ncbi:hypothetical protein SLE2022_127480 [Rubroshorea leprosula]